MKILKKMKHKNFTLGVFCLGGFLSGVYVQGVFVRGGGVVLEPLYYFSEFLTQFC